MKTFFLIAALATLSFAGCKKDSTVTNNPGGGSGGTGGGGGGSTNNLAISSITPTAYCDDTITITGTGFDADKTKDTVDFGILNSSNVYSIPDPNACVVNSASTTQLKVTITNSFNFGGNLIFLNPLAVARVRTTLGKVYSGNIYFKVAPLFTDIEDITAPAGSNVVRVSDSVSCINGIGIGNLSYSSFSIGGTSFHPVIDSSSNCKFGFVLPYNLLGSNLDESKHQTAAVILTMKDGKTVSQNIDVYVSPLMHISSTTPATPVFYKSTAAPGAVEVINISGIYLKSDAIIEHTYTGGSDVTGLTATDFSTTASTSYTVSLLALGVHYISIYRMENGVKKVYGNTAFTINP